MSFTPVTPVLKGWRVLLLEEERARLWYDAVVRQNGCEMNVVTLADVSIILVTFSAAPHQVCVSSGDNPTPPSPASPVMRPPLTVPLLTPEELSAKAEAAIPRKQALWLVGCPEVFWNSVFLGKVMGGTCGVQWIDELLQEPQRTYDRLCAIHADDMTIFHSNVVTRC